jgi:pyruvate-formate lyase-activating enzyme
VSGTGPDRGAVGPGPALVVELVKAMAGVAPGGTVAVPVSSSTEADVVEAWCRRTGNHVVGTSNGTVEVRRGSARDPFADLPEDRRPGARLWLYTNFDCNLACDYCCVRSSPRTARRGLGLDRVRRIAREAPAAGVRELFLTGGEPFLLPDLGDVVAACATAAPTTVLTNGMLFRGRRLATLRSFPRDRVALQISLDSAEPEGHDRHRGRGSWARAVEGIRIALAERFRVRVAATLGTEELGREAAFHRFLDRLGVRREDRLVRRVARRGAATEGVVVTTETLVPEVTLTADGVYWHPVAAIDPDMLVTREMFPLAAAVALVRDRFAERRRRLDAAADLFPCA